MGNASLPLLDCAENPTSCLTFAFVGIADDDTTSVIGLYLAIPKHQFLASWLTYPTCWAPSQQQLSLDGTPLGSTPPSNIRHHHATCMWGFVEGDHDKLIWQSIHVNLWRDQASYLYHLIHLNRMQRFLLLLRAPNSSPESLDPPFRWPFPALVRTWEAGRLQKYLKVPNGRFGKDLDGWQPDQVFLCFNFFHWEKSPTCLATLCLGQLVWACTISAQDAWNILDYLDC